MTDTIGSAQVVVGADTSGAVAKIRELEANFDRAMNDMGRQRAEAEVDVKTTDFDRRMAEIKTRLVEIDEEKANPEIKINSKEAKAEIKDLRLELKRLSADRTTIKVDLKELKDANAEEARFAKQEALSEKAILAKGRAVERVAKTERDNVKMRRDAERQMVSERSEVERLRSTYAKLAGEQERLQRKTGRPGGIFRTANESRELKRVGADMELAAHKIRALGGSVDDIDPDIERHQGLLGRWASSLSSVRLQLGFFSATLRQLGIGIVAAGPVVTGLIGALSSLIGVAGTGLAGAISVGSAALGGFALSALGVGLVLKPAIDDFKLATSASEAYHKAVVKYGKGSEQAKTAQEQLNQTLKGISPVAKKAVKDFGGIKDQWGKLTKATRAPIFDAIGSSIKTVQALLPSFASQTVATTKTLSKGWQGWMKSLRSSEAKDILNDLMGNFRKSLPGFMSGLASLGATIGRIAQSASKFLPDLSQGFADWADSMEEAVGGGDSLDDDMGRLITHMRDIGHLAQASGGVLATFFGTGADSGDDLVNSATESLNKLNNSMKSESGQSSLKKFFSEAADETKQLVPVLARAGELIFAMGRATAPISTGFLKVLNVVGDVVSALAKFEPIRGILAGVGAVMATMWTVGKVQAFAGAVRDAGTALKGLAAAQGLSDLANGAGITGLFGKSGAAKGATRDARAAQAAWIGMAGAESAATAESGLLAAAMAPEVLIPAGLIVGLGLLIDGIVETKDAWSEAVETFHNTEDEIPHAINAVTKGADKYTGAANNYANATDEVSKAQHRLIKAQGGGNQRQRLAAAVSLAQAERNQAQAQRQVGVQNEASIKSSEGLLKAAKRRIASAKSVLAAGKGEKAEVERMFPDARPVAAIRKIAKGEEDLAEAQREVAAAEQAQALAAIPVERSYRNLQPLSEQTQHGLEQLAKTAGSAAVKNIGSFVKPQDVARVTSLSNKLTTLGRGSEVKNIDVKSKGADEASAKLQRLARQSEKVDGKAATLNVKTNDKGAQQKLTQLSRLSQRVTGSRNTIKILANSSSAEAAIAKLSSHLKAVAMRKYEARLDAIDNTRNARDGAYHNLREVASKKYEARITAVDKASSVASRADAAGKKVAGGHYEAKITANAGAALQTMGFVQGYLQGLDGMTAETKVITVHEDVHKSRGEYSGGVHMAATGASSGMLDSAADRASKDAKVRAGVGRKVTKPTFLVGEEGQAAPEYVIATNPRYRARNERYLSDAADDFGYDLVPAYKKGKGAKQISTPKHQKIRHGYLKVSKNWHKEDNQYNLVSSDVGIQESGYNAELDHQERRIKAGSLDEYEYGKLKPFLTAERADFDRMKSVTNEIRKDASKVVNKTAYDLLHYLGTGKGSAIAGEKDRIKDLSKAINKTKDKDKKKHLNDEKRNSEKALAKLQKEREKAQELNREAKEKLAEVTGEQGAQREAQRKIEASENDVNLEYFQPELEKSRNEERDEGKGGKETKTIGEQTASLNEQRENLYREYGSNIVGYGGAGAGTITPAEGAINAGALGGAPTAYVTSAAGGVAKTNAVTSAPEGKTAGTTNNVVNNFAAPPPDPHTWTRNQLFELGAFA